jgi:plasmid maintenance system killer protein
MIDLFLIENAKKIRKNFLDLNSRLSTYQDDLKDTAETFLDISKKLQLIKDQVGKKPIEKIQKEIFDQLNFLEDKAKKIEELIIPLNNEMEDLRKSEQKLWEKIKKKYPKEKEEDLIAEVHKHISK